MRRRVKGTGLEVRKLRSKRSEMGPRQVVNEVMQICVGMQICVVCISTSSAIGPPPKGWNARNVLRNSGKVETSRVK